MTKDAKSVGINANMSISRRQSSARTARWLAIALWCLVPATAIAKDASTPVSVLSNGTLSLVTEVSSSDSADTPPFSLVMDDTAGLDFDLGGSEKRKLQLVLDHPLTLSTGTHARVLDNGGKYELLLTAVPAGCRTDAAWRARVS